jgi:hypothetical protein
MMKRVNLFNLGKMFLLLVALSSAVGCTWFRRGGETQTVVSPAPVPSAAPFERVEELPKVELFYGEGDCGPRFPNGMRGTCINNQPCNGFGVRGTNGSLECDCFGTKGGCGEGKVCSVIMRACVTLREAERKHR